ncbi:MAG: UDP-N-acetylmuramoyl-L-alanyl-D-glutamate--2,6-diaminopimelate ligase [Planctomycetes bacterium]|nr:UDP-N-acetylmuramoyl-L-alanyl-D-glutamate--2,6-diaminopimelate ligase [Planctomycetota bacterium]
MKLSSLKKILPQAEFVNFQDIDFTDISYDSRQAKPGNLFVAIPGTKKDGQSFIGEAIHRGCVAFVTKIKSDLHPNIPQIVSTDPRQALAAISNSFYQNPDSKLKVIGITGTNGKTTTAYLLKSILEAGGGKVGQLGTIAYHLGPREIPAPLTTPESYEINKFLAEMVSLGLTHAVMEVSSHALIQQRVSRINLAQAIFTNLGRDHFDYHRTLKEYRNAKSLLFKYLSTRAGAILNRDDENSDYFAGLTKGQITWYGLEKEADVTAEIKQISLTGSELTLRLPGVELPLRTKLIGRHNVYNILAAAAGAVSLGIKPEMIGRGIEAVSGVRGRLELIPNDRDFQVMVDFAHTAGALENVLTVLKKLVSGRLIVVFGAGGDRDKGKRPIMGETAARHADVVVLTSDNPRSEDPKKIIEDIKKGLPEKCRYYTYPDRQEAIVRALALARPKDLVLLAGKGHETYQIFKDTVKPFDDRAVARQILKQ